MTAFKSGFVSIVGCPNVGKSTLLNRLVGQKVAIVSPKAQTTRNRVTGILTRPGVQMIFLDTPGIAAPKNKLGAFMRRVAYASLDDVEAVLYIVDPVAGLRERDEALAQRLKTSKAPCVGVINKVDIASAQQLGAAQEFLGENGICDHIVQVSAKEGTGIQELLALLHAYLVDGPQYFPDDMYTDQPERQLCAELIREKALTLLREEIPHGIGIEIEKMSLREDQKLMDIFAAIYCERETHKGIIIGKRGCMLRNIGEQARVDMEWMLGVRVNLQLFVKVREDWRNSPLALHELGYDDKN